MNDSRLIQTTPLPISEFMQPSRFRSKAQQYPSYPITKTTSRSRKKSTVTDTLSSCSSFDNSLSSVISMQSRSMADVDTSDEEEEPIAKNSKNCRKPAKRKQRTSMAQMQEQEDQRLQIHQRNLEQKSLNRTEQRCVQYGPDGKPLIETSFTSHTEHQDKKQDTVAMLHYQRTRCVTALTQIEALNPEQCKTKSRAYVYLEAQIRRELEIFHKQVMFRLGGNLNLVWKNHEFIKRFLFGLETSWSQNSQMPVANVPWLACLWTMPEMLALCQDMSWVFTYCSHRYHHMYYGANISRFPKKLFCINSQMMAGYTTGHLFAHLFEPLSKLMRDCVKQEIEQSYFPSFDSHELFNDCPSMVFLKYDFDLVDFVFDKPNEQEHDDVCAPHCAQRDTCCLLGAGTDIEIDYPLILLMQKNTLRQQLCNQVHSTVQTIAACDWQDKHHNQLMSAYIENNL